MPLNEDLDTLKQIGDLARAEPGLSRLADYCAHRSAGLRKPALADMAAFLTEVNSKDFDDRLRAARWVAAQAKRLRDRRLLVLAPLLVELLDPVLRKWATKAPDSAEAHYLAALWCLPPEDDTLPHRLYFLRRAIALEPTHDEARKQFVDWFTGSVDYNQHELPWGYLGDPAKDLADLKEARDIADGVGDPELREALLDEIAEYREVAGEYRAFRRAGTVPDFASWCLSRQVLPQYSRWAREAD